MKIEINIEKKHLIFFGIFIIIIGTALVFSQNYETFGHSASEIGPGTMVGPIIVLTPIGDGDGLKGVTKTGGKSAIYGFVPEGYSAYSGFFEGGDVVIYDGKLIFEDETMPDSTVSIKMESGRLVFEDAFAGPRTLSELVAGGGSSPWITCTGGICYSGGNVGIGTNNPTVELEVDGDITATGQICDSNGCIVGVRNCPGGYQLVKNGWDGKEFGCMEIEEHNSAAWWGAATSCWNDDARLPTSAEWAIAAGHYYNQLEGLGDNDEWVLDCTGTNEHARAKKLATSIDFNPANDYDYSTYRCWIPFL